ncbi:Uncharacterised protein [Plesiomonas shigelloides]|nr:Uncharacterised protein [Plesiomonas shigelloides]
MMLSKMSSPKHILKLLFIILYVLFIVATMFLAVSFITTLHETNSLQLQVCVTNACLGDAKETYKNIIDMFFGLITVITAVATVGGIIVAALTYVNNASSNAMGNHIAHLQIFKDYLIVEVNKRDRVVMSVIDFYGWYNLIFNDSINGVMSVSYKYKEVVSKINQAIEISNEESTTAKNGSFRYKEHQKRMNQAIAAIGITMNFHPRNDYFEIEEQVLTLISSINSAFCSTANLIPFSKREYI